MECGKLTAKFRDAVPVCFIVNGIEVKRLKNVEIPDEIKKLPFEDYKLDVWENGGHYLRNPIQRGRVAG